MSSSRSILTPRRSLTGLLVGAALLGAAAAPQAASAKGHHAHHPHRAERNEAPAGTCHPGDLTMVGSGKEARLWVCRADGTWTEAVYAVTRGGHTSVVNAGRA